MKPQREKEKMVDEIKALADAGPVLKTQEGRALHNVLLRLAETVAYGEPKTQPLPKHHG